MCIDKNSDFYSSIDPTSIVPTLQRGNQCLSRSSGVYDTGRWSVQVQDATHLLPDESDC